MDNNNAVFARLFASPRDSPNALAVIHHPNNKARYRAAQEPTKGYIELKSRTTTTGVSPVQSGSDQRSLASNAQNEVSASYKNVDDRRAEWLLPCEEDDTLRAVDEMIPDPDRECLELRFQDPRNFRQGILIGRSPGSRGPESNAPDQHDGCDIQVPYEQRSVGQRQVLITFDSENRLILQDVQDADSDKAVTAVSYNIHIQDIHNQRVDLRRHFTWILSGTSFTESQIARVSISPSLAFFIIVEPFCPRSSVHEMNVRRFWDFFDDLVEDHERKYRPGLHVTAPTSLASTQAPSGYLTPAYISTGPVYVVDKIGSGGQATVEKRWDVSTGKVFAAKEYGVDSRHRYETEVKILKDVKHTHVVRLMFAEDVDRRMYLELAPLGSLHNQVAIKPLMPIENLAILQQVLSALAYLHSLRPAIVHRDLKPANILVFSRESYTQTYPILVKLCDFGFSKADRGELTTKVWSEGWAAPEVRTHGRHTEKMDLWSLGMISLKFSHGWPPFPPTEEEHSQHHSSHFWTTWMHRILKMFDQQAHLCEFAQFVGRHLLQEHPADRLSAQEAEHAARNLKACSCIRDLEPMAMPENMSIAEGNTLYQSDSSFSASALGAVMMGDQASAQLDASADKQSRIQPSLDSSSPGNYGLHAKHITPVIMTLRSRENHNNRVRHEHKPDIGIPRQATFSDHKTLDELTEESGFEGESQEKKLL